MNATSQEESITVKLDSNHPLMVLKRLIPFEEIIDTVKKSIVKSSQGRKRDINHHVRALILSIYLNIRSYRELVESLKSNLYARSFCNMNENNAPYTHTAYMKFFNDLPIFAYDDINFEIINLAKTMRLTKIIDIDVDSTPKEANITYPTDAKNLKTLMMMTHNCLSYFCNNGYRSEVSFALKFNYKKALSDFKIYFFEKNQDEKMALLNSLTKRIRIFVENALFSFEKISMPKIKWYIERKIEKIKRYGKKYIKQVQHYCRTGRACQNKLLSFHIENVACIQKGKDHKKYEFGEIWQIGRLDGNFCFGMFNEKDLRYNDATAIQDILEKVELKTGSKLNTITADRAYWSDENINSVDSMGVSEQGIHPKGNKMWRVSDVDLIETFINRRAGIEPIIGHLKKLGLGKSRMRTDTGTRGEGARSFIAFNVRKILEAVL